MTADTIVGYIATAFALIGLGVGVARWRHLDLGLKLATAYLGATALTDLVVYYVSAHSTRVQSVVRIWFLVSVLLVCATLATFQHDGRRAIWLRVAAIVYGIAWLILSFTVEAFDAYSTYAGPLSGVVILGAALMTIFRRVALARRDLAADPGFLVAVAFAAIGLPTAFQTVVVQLWLNNLIGRGIAYYAMNNAINAFAALILINALRIPGRASESGA